MAPCRQVNHSVRPSDVVYVRDSGFDPMASAGGGAQGRSSTSERARAWPMAHMPTPSNDTSTVVASPVRSRWNRAPMMPPAMVIAPMESPNPGAGGGGTRSYSGRWAPAATPDRAQKASES